MPTPDKSPSNALLEQMRYRADPLADATVSQIIGHWNDLPPLAGVEDSQRINADQWRRLGSVSRLFGKWQDNASLAGWKAQDQATSPAIAAKLEDYVKTARDLPEWADASKIEAAEKVFLDYGVLSCTLLFCSSLPECYVTPDLASVLHVSGQLETNTDYRIRATAAMIFPVMMPGGLTHADGSGIAQILKVRLIHATIRNLILRGNPEDVAGVVHADRHTPPHKVLSPLPNVRATDDMYQSLFALGWDLSDNGLPCNQEELAYTLLTFSYVFLRSLRRLGLGLPQAQEEAYLHTWNVVGHILGIRRELMVDTMDQSAELFALIQARGRARKVEPDQRPALTRALMQTMENVIPLRLLKPFPTLLTIHLCGRATAKDLGLHRRPALWIPRLLFAICMLLARVIDAVVRRLIPGCSIANLMTRVTGARFMSQILMSQTRPLKLPKSLLNQVQTMLDGWTPKSPDKRRRGSA